MGIFKQTSRFENHNLNNQKINKIEHNEKRND